MNERRQDILGEKLGKLFPEYEEAKMILNDGVIALLVKDSVELVNLIDEENGVILRESNKLATFLDRIHQLEDEIRAFMQKLSGIGALVMPKNMVESKY